MGYTSRVNGQLYFLRSVEETPEIPKELIEEAAKYGAVIAQPEPLIGLSEAAIEKMQADSEISWWFPEIDEEVADADDSESGKAYNLEGIIRSLVKIAVEDGCTVSGTINVRGEEAGDIWRVIVKNNVQHREDVIITWPDGTRYPNR